MLECIQTCWLMLREASTSPCPTSPDFAFCVCLLTLPTAFSYCLSLLPLPSAFSCCSCLLPIACFCLQGILPPGELSDLAASPHPPNYVLGILSELVASTCFSSPERYRMEQNITFFHDCHGKCERILMTPIPLSYTR